RRVPVQVERMVEEQVVRRVPVSEIRTQYEERTEYVPADACANYAPTPGSASPAPAEPPPASVQPPAAGGTNETTPQPSLGPNEGNPPAKSTEAAPLYDRLVPVVSPRRLAEARGQQ
ncbi:MAG TPA: hypothetical protein VG713_03695, partial [Pirellulales bacterium]|nr:hypothetical protein [Pirellulales bacterium]